MVLALHIGPGLSRRCCVSRKRAGHDGELALLRFTTVWGFGLFLRGEHIMQSLSNWGLCFIRHGGVDNDWEEKHSQN